jgi:hypothetical protein
MGDPRDCMDIVEQRRSRFVEGCSERASRKGGGEAGTVDDCRDTGGRAKQEPEPRTLPGSCLLTSDIQKQPPLCDSHHTEKKPPTL